MRVAVGQLDLAPDEDLLLPPSPRRGQEPAAPAQLGVGDVGRARLLHLARRLDRAQRLHDHRHGAPDVRRQAAGARGSRGRRRCGATPPPSTWRATCRRRAGGPIPPPPPWATATAVVGPDRRGADALHRGRVTGRARGTRPRRRRRARRRPAHRETTPRPRRSTRRSSRRRSAATSRSRTVHAPCRRRRRSSRTGQLARRGRSRPGAPRGERRAPRRSTRAAYEARGRSRVPSSPPSTSGGGRITTRRRRARRAPPTARGGPPTLACQRRQHARPRADPAHLVLLAQEHESRVRGAEHRREGPARAVVQHPDADARPGASTSDVGAPGSTRTSLMPEERARTAPRPPPERSDVAERVGRPLLCRPARDRPGGDADPDASDASATTTPDRRGDEPAARPRRSPARRHGGDLSAPPSRHEAAPLERPEPVPRR